MRALRVVLFAVICAAGVTVQAEEDAIRLLAIGNSFADNALTYFSDISRAGGKQVLVGKACLGGCDIERHMRHADAFDADPADPEGRPYANGEKSLRQLLEQEPWDYVTIQQVSHKSFRPQSYHPHVDRLIAYIRRYAPQAEILIHQTWAYRDDHGFWGEQGLNTDSMYRRLCAAYDTLSKETGFRQIPSGDAMEAARQDPDWGPFVPDPDFDPQTAVYPELPENDVHALHNGWYGWKKDEKTGVRYLSRDCIHANREGKYLLGCVWFEFFFDHSVIGNPFCPSGMSTEDALVLQRIAHRVVGRGIQKTIDEALRAGKSEIVLPAGRYEVRPQEGTHLLLENLSDVTIDASGVELVCTETTRAISIKFCTNLTIRGLTVDYDPLPFTQGRIADISADGHTHTIHLFEGYPPAESAIGFKYEIFQSDGETLRFGEYHDVLVEVLNARALRVIKAESQRWKEGGEQVGDLIVIGSEKVFGGALPHALVAENCRNLELDKITLYASNSFGFLETDCDRTVYRDCRIGRRSPDSDPIVREQPRLRSLNADAYHSKFAVHGPRLLNCSASYQGDDAVNINGSYHLITSASQEILHVLAKSGMDIRAGDPVELVDRSGAVIGEAKVRSVRPDGMITADEKALVEKLPILEQVRSLLGKRFIIELDQKIDLEPGSIICSRNRMGNGLEIRDCFFGFNRSRGILIKAGDGVVSGNRIEQAGMQGILISPEYHWLEAGYVKNLRVENNEIVHCGGEAIAVRGIGSGSGHRNIELVGNRIISEHEPAMVLSGVQDLHIEANLLNGAAFTPDAD